ncbi:sugar phosphate isomerase/epimerase [Paenibacillus qinlingensis]|uniref:Sugar phosphate isomerase/epimerase n=1 Tax=Paenibacillus qinlingensis TaxID=1837343 RepID=A0ABU1NR39_9BACL|nr:sugar phosphate isomerase/epimerase [Paenibacillus qinlingensis]MDR6549923.1 sugar phosphate isomerase/epimerase [Paenibacillus qinlingensis]
MRNRFLIGQYGCFDESKMQRDFRKGFFGIEACLFETEEDRHRLILASQRNHFQVGIHFPLRPHVSKMRDALFLANSPEMRESSYAWVQSELEYLASMNPTYILFHYPKPVVLDDRVDWRTWRFSDKSEYMSETEMTLTELIERTEVLFQWLTMKSETYGFIPVLEFDALNRYIYETDFLEELLGKYPHIKVCLDTARLYLQEKLDPYFDARKVIHKFARFAYSIHLSTVQIKDSTTNSRHPVLPELDQRDGWAPIEDYLAIITEQNDQVMIMFEHRSDLISEDQLNQCYDWVTHLLNNGKLMRSNHSY